MDEQPQQNIFLYLLDVIVSPIFVKGIVTLAASLSLIYLVVTGVAGLELLVAIITGGGIISVASSSSGGIPKRSGNGSNGHIPTPPRPAKRESVSYHPDDIMRMGDRYFLEKYPPEEWARTALGDGGVLFVKKDRNDDREATGPQYG